MPLIRSRRKRALFLTSDSSSIVSEESYTMHSRTELPRLAARFSTQYSSFAETDSTASRYFNLLVKFMTNSYLSILTRYSLDIVYSSEGINESVSTIDLAYKSGITATDEAITSWTKEIERLEFYGFDEITALSEEAVNLMYSSLWYEASRRQPEDLLANWSSEKFTASFGAPSIRLLSNGKAVVWITVRRGDVELPG